MTEGEPSRRRFPVVPVVSGIAGAALALGAVGLVWGLRSSSGSAHHPPATTTTTAVTLSADATRLEHLLAAGNTVTYHAAYKLTSTDPRAANGAVVIEVWRMPPLERQDTAVNVPGSPSEHQEALQASSGLVSCTQAGTGAWSCQSIGGSALPSGPGAVIQQITSSLAGDQVASREATVAGVAAHCFDLTQATTKLSLCLDASGIPVEVTDGTNTMELTELDHVVAKSVFTPPAAVSSGTLPGTGP